MKKRLSRNDTPRDGSDGDRSLEVLDAVYHDAALVEAEEGASTLEDDAWALDLRATIQARLAAIKRAMPPTSTSGQQAPRAHGTGAPPHGQHDDHSDDGLPPELLAIEAQSD